MTEDEKFDVSLDIIKSGACRSRQTIWNWATNKNTPNKPIVRDIASRAVNRVLSIRTTPRTLFAH